MCRHTSRGARGRCRRCAAGTATFAAAGDPSAPAASRETVRSTWGRSCGLVLPFKVARFDLPRLPPVLERELGPDGAVLALAVEVPTGAAALGPDALLELLLDHIVELTLRLCGGIRGNGAAPVHLLEHVDDELRLLLDHEDHRVVSECGVGAKHEVQVRETVDCHTHVCLDAVLLELLRQVETAAAANAEVVERVDDVEAGAINDHVGVMDIAGLVDHARWGYLGDALGVELDIVAVERLSLIHISEPTRPY